jgi:hypothetical protein
MKRLAILELLVPAEDIQLGVNSNDDRIYSRLHIFAFKSEVPPFETVKVYDNDLGRHPLHLDVISSKDEYEAGVIDGKDCAAWVGELW